MVDDGAYCNACTSSLNTVRGQAYCENCSFYLVIILWYFMAQIKINCTADAFGHFSGNNVLTTLLQQCRDGWNKGPFLQGHTWNKLCGIISTSCACGWFVPYLLQNLPGRVKAVTEAVPQLALVQIVEDPVCRMQEANKSWALMLKSNF